MATVANLSVVLDLFNRPFVAGLNAARSALRAFNVELSTVFAHAGPFTFRMGPGAAGMGALVAGIAKLGIEAVKTAADFERMEAALTVMTGSAERAKELMNEMVQFAAATPFELKDVTTGTQRLIAYGFAADQAIPILSKLGDMAAAWPGGMEQGLERVIRAIGQMRSHGVVRAQELNQLAEAGVPAWEALAAQISKVSGETVTVARAMEMVEDRSVTARTGIMAIFHASERFAGTQERIMQTLPGLWSNFRDNVTMFMRALGDVITEGFGLKDATRSLTDFFGFLRSQMDNIRPAVLFIGQVFRTTFEVALAAARELVRTLSDLTRNIDASPERLADLRGKIIDLFESAALGARGFINEAKIAAGTVLEDFGAPLLRVLSHLVKGFEYVVVLIGKVGISVDTLLPGLALLRDFAGWLGDKFKGTKAPSDALAVAQGLADAADALAAQGKGLRATDPNAGLAGIRDFAAGVRAGITPLQAAQGLVAGLAVAMKDLGRATKEVSLPFTGFSKKIQDAIKDMKGPLHQHAQDWKAMNNEIADNTLAGFDLMARGHFAMLGAMAVARRAATIQMGRDFLELQKKFGPSAEGFQALEGRSREAGAAINKVLNRRANADQDPQAIMKAMLALQKQQNDNLLKIGEKVEAAGKNAGLW